MFRSHLKDYVKITARIVRSNSTTLLEKDPEFDPALIRSSGHQTVAGREQPARRKEYPLPNAWYPITTNHNLYLGLAN